MKKVTYLFVLVTLFLNSCDSYDEYLVGKSHVEIENDREYQTDTIRNINDVLDVVSDYYNFERTRGHSLICNVSNISALKVTDIISQTRGNSPDYIDFSKSDTLLYAVNTDDRTLLISANKNAHPILGILDNEEFSFDHFFKDSPKDNPFSDFLEMAILYNVNPNVFPEVEQECTRSGVVVNEVLPKVKVAWDQHAPFNKYCKKKNGTTVAAGCVAIAIAQAFTVTRHVDSYDGIPLNYDNLINVQNGSYQDIYPSICDTIAKFIFKVGCDSKIDYADGDTGTDLSDGIKVMTRSLKFGVTYNKSYIRNTLSIFPTGIVLIGSFNKSNGLFGIARGSGHAYIADGYKIFDTGEDFIHVNMGWGPYYNGYYLTRLTAPYFVESCPDEVKYPHHWSFYCMYPNSN